MNYISLYRKWRSQNFDEIVGQQHIVRTLKNAISMKRLAHAYLFTGPRGTGKTSLARILAKALNCKKGMTPFLCGKCDSCEKITIGSAIDVIEIDAASNRGIDEIRDLREKIRYMPVEGRYKIYIIDEVHMLTQEAFNALLKTLEEPPEHVVFVLATTEPNRVPVTISSRCQRLDFQRIPLAEIKTHLMKISKEEKVTVDDKALDLIARAGEGSMRDSVSLLDQLISFAGNKIDSDQVAMLLGGVGEEMLFNMSKAISANDMNGVVSSLREAIDAGRSASQIVADLIVFYRNLLLVKLNASEALELSQDYLERLTLEAKSYNVNRIKEILKALSKTGLDMKWHAQARILLEVALLELLEEKCACPPKPEGRRRETKSEERLPSAEPIVATATDGRMMKIKKHWKEVLDYVKKKSLFGYVSLHEGHPIEINDTNQLVINFKKGFAFHKERLEEQNNKIVVESAIKEVVGEEILITCRVGDAGQNNVLPVQVVAEIFK